MSGSGKKVCKNIVLVAFLSIALCFMKINAAKAGVFDSNGSGNLWGDYSMSSLPGGTNYYGYPGFLGIMWLCPGGMGPYGMGQYNNLLANLTGFGPLAMINQGMGFSNWNNAPSEAAFGFGGAPVYQAAAQCGGHGLSADKYEYLPGDFHQHTLYTDGATPFFTQAQKNDMRLDWWANSEHGGGINRDGDGIFWDTYSINPILGDQEMSDDHQVMWRWQSLRDFAYPDILTARWMYPDKTIISGLEWNVPSHEHCSTAIYQYNNTATLISEFEYRFDESDSDTSRDGEASLLSGFGPLSKTNVTKDDAISAVKFMQALKDQGLGDAWVVPAHIERQQAYTVADFRDWNNAGPDVAFGFEGTPGHQADSDRGGFGSDADGGCTYGGTGVYSAKVGGLWDALLGEGRNFWNFASSDYHDHWSNGGGDFYPGEYQKEYNYINTSNPDKYQAVVDGLRSGNSWYVEGDLIDKLIFTARNAKGDVAAMGQTLKVAPGEKITISIQVNDPQGVNNCPLDMDNPSLAQIGIYQALNAPMLDHIDLIAGDVTGHMDPNTADYAKNTNETAKVINTFTTNNNNGREIMFTITHVVQEDQYFRLRGTNLPAKVPYETDKDANPLPDTEAKDHIYGGMNEEDLVTRLFPGVTVTSNNCLAEVAEAYADLWFYSNPIFVKVVK
jgi:hypothetical protein